MTLRRQRGQAAAETIGLVAIVATLAIAASASLGGGAAPRAVIAAIRSAIRHEQPRHGDRWAMANATLGPLIRRYAPQLVLERDVYGVDGEVPVDFIACRAASCARFGVARPTAFVHVVRRSDATYISYWLYYPDSIGAHLPITALSGYHRDDWEGVVVRVDGTGVAARATAHLGLQGARPWWSEEPGWHPITAHPPVFRASGSHANGFGPVDLDLAGDAWNGTLAAVPLSDLVPADEAPSRHARFDREAPPPWHKLLWDDPTATSTSDVPGRGAAFAAARALALLLGKG